MMVISPLGGCVRCSPIFRKALGMAFGRLVVHPLRRAGGERVARGWGRGGGGAESEGGGAVWRGVVSGITVRRP